MSRGIICSFSKLSAQSPIINPKRLNATQVRTRKLSIQKGCAIFKSTKRFAVTRMIVAKISDLVAAAPT